MGSAGNFHPEWGYFAPMPGFRRSLRVAVIAAAIGATAGSVVVVSLVNPSRSRAYNSPISARVLISHTQVISSPGDAVTGAPAAAADTAPPALSSLSSDPDRSIETAPAAASTMPPFAGAKRTPGVVQARKRPGEVHRSRVANVLRHPRYQHGLAWSFQLPHNSRLVQFDQPCCAWTMPPTQRDAFQW